MYRSLLAALLTTIIGAGCASSASSKVYPRYQAQQAWTVEYGEVAGLDSVLIEGERSYLGRAGGGYIGYELGRAAVDGSSRGVAGAVGAVAGAVAGGAVEERVTRQQGLQITVDLDEGSTVAIVQAADQPFAVGERVKVLRGQRGAARVTKI
jgi:outer membrane lipoprotein SlyB